MLQAINPNLSQFKISFKNHPDYTRLSKNYSICASSYFRRGAQYGSADKNFQDIVTIFQKIFNENTNKPVKMLIAGIGKSQEPFSYLAVIKDLTTKKLDDVIDLNIIDLQSKPIKENLFKNSYYEYSHQPEFAANSFIKDYKDKIIFNSLPGYYRVNDDIFNFLNKTYSDHTKSKWESRLQETIIKYNSSEFDIISVNNTIGYIDNSTERINTLKNIYRSLKENGILITDPNPYFIEQAGLSDKLKLLKDGIYKK